MANRQGTLMAGDIQTERDAIGVFRAGLNAVNDKVRRGEFNNRDLNLLMPVVQRVEGREIETLVYEDFQIFFEDYSDYVNPEVYKEIKHVWTLTSKSFTTKSGEFTRKWLKNIKMNNQNPYAKIIEREQAVFNKYLNVFLPNYLWESILVVPAENQDYYETKGALNNTKVDKSLLRGYDPGALAGSLNSDVRNHLRAIEGANITYEDIKFFRQYLSRYIDVDPNKIVMFGNMVTEDELETIFNDTQTLDNVMIGNISLGEGTKIKGMPFIRTDKLGDYQLLFMVMDETKPIIAQLVNSLDEYKGLNFEAEKDLEAFESINDLKGGRFIIENIGNQVIAGHRLMLVDITPNRYANNIDRLMNQTGKDEIKKQREFLNAQWKIAVA